MKTKCTQGTRHGDDVTVSFFIPEQEEVDDGQLPYLYVDCLSLLVEEEANTIDHDTCCGFEVDFMELLTEGIDSAEEAETVALWLEQYAAQIRAKVTP